MKPTLELLFCPDIEGDLALTADHGISRVRGKGSWKTEDDLFHEQMMDTLSEIANVFIGLYAKAIYGISKLNAHYSVPYAVKDNKQQIVRHFLWAPEASDQQHLVIENEFFVHGKPIKLWCLFCPTRKSLQNILKRIEANDEYY
jgi:hypothetical protein